MRRAVIAAFCEVVLAHVLLQEGRSGHTIATALTAVLGALPLVAVEMDLEIMLPGASEVTPLTTKLVIHLPQLSRDFKHALAAGAHLLGCSYDKLGLI